MKILNIEFKNIFLFQNAKIDFLIHKKYKDSNFDNTYHVNNLKINPKIGIIGKNSSGKSTLLKNIYFIDDLLSDNIITKTLSFLYEQLFRNINKNNNLESNILNYNLIQKSLKFEFCYNEEHELEYIIKLLNNNKNNIIKINFDIDNLIINISHNDINKKFNLKMFLDNFIYIIKNNIDFNNINKIFEIFNRETIKIKNEYINFLKELDLLKYINLIQYSNKWNIHSKFIENYINNNLKNKDRILDWLKIADNSIENFAYNDKKQVIGFLNNTKNEPIPFDYLSIGTIKWFGYFPIIFNKESNLIVIDEIETSLHPLLTKTLIKTIYNVNKQILFTTHNPLLFPKGYRPDAIYYVEKNLDNKANLYLVSDYYKIERSNSIANMIQQNIIGDSPDINDICDFWDKISDYNE